MNVKADIPNGVRSGGFMFVDGADFLLDDACARALDVLCGAWSELPPDPYLPRGAAYRQRRHARFLLHDDGGIQQDDAAGYFQSVEANRLAGGVVRYFAPFEEEQARNRFLHGLMYRNAALFTSCRRTPPARWTINVHMMRTTASPGTVGFPSPEGVHRDGFDFIAVHHVSQKNISGGCTEIRSTGGVLLTRRTLTRPLDTLYADDARVLHDVTPVVWDGRGGSGHRDMLLMSYEAGY
ncbi:2OG-Fe dioxygenase family protein [Streptomyces sp. LARHCF249]